jgi:hypothetical protein
LPATHDCGRFFLHAIPLSPAAPVVHRALTAEYEDPGRYSNSVVIKTPFAREGKWLGVRMPWLSMQVKLPVGEWLLSAKWGIVVGWWRQPEDEGGWSKLLEATRLGHKPDGDDERYFNDPASAGLRGPLSPGIKRRVDDKPDVRANG